MFVWRVLFFFYNKKGRNILWNFVDNSKRMLFCYVYVLCIKEKLMFVINIMFVLWIINLCFNFFGVIWMSSLIDY